MDPSPSEMISAVSKFPSPLEPPETLMSADCLSISLYRRFREGDTPASAIEPARAGRARPTAYCVVGPHFFGRGEEGFGDVGELIRHGVLGARVDISPNQAGHKILS